MKSWRHLHRQRWPERLVWTMRITRMPWWIIIQEEMVIVSEKNRLMHQILVVVVGCGVELFLTADVRSTTIKVRSASSNIIVPLRLVSDVSSPRGPACGLYYMQKTSIPAPGPRPPASQKKFIQLWIALSSHRWAVGSAQNGSVGWIESTSRRGRKWRWQFRHPIRFQAGKGENSTAVLSRIASIVVLSCCYRMSLQDAMRLRIVCYER